jgi:outer membrane immunogenic protein
MRRLAIIGAGLFSMAGSISGASAADLPALPYSKAPVFAAPIYDWSGFYMGINGGGASSHECYTLTSIPGLVGTANEGCHSATGGLAGGQAGYRWQRAAWIFGVEVQGEKGYLSGSNPSLTALIPYNNKTTVDDIGLFTGQVGYAWKNALFYAKGGAAITDNRYSSSFPVGNFFAAAGVPFNESSDTRWGGTVGAGVEYGFAPDWTVAVEYDHLFMGRQSVIFPATPIGGGRTDTIGQDVDMATARLNYHFDGPFTSW